MSGFCQLFLTLYNNLLYNMLKNDKYLYIGVAPS
jgi:hypothetical protein